MLREKIVEARFAAVPQGYAEIGRRFSILSKTVRDICLMYAERGHVKRKVHPAKKRKLTREILDWMCSKEILKAWVGKTLSERKYLIYARWGVSVHETTLALYYRKEGIRYLKPNYHWSSRHNEETLHRMQKEFVLDLIGHMKNNREIFFMD